MQPPFIILREKGVNMDDAKYNRQMRAVEKDRLRNYLLDGGLGAYIHYNREL